jgi:hypothetical protein
MNRMDDRLTGLWAEYRAAVPDSDPSPNFMPRLWQRIDARRNEQLSVFRRLAQACVMATLALALLMAVLIPELQKDQGLTGTYVDVLAAEQSNGDAAVLDVDSML